MVDGSRLEVGPGVIVTAPKRHRMASSHSGTDWLRLTAIHSAPKFVTEMARAIRSSPCLRASHQT